MSTARSTAARRLFSVLLPQYFLNRSQAPAIPGPLEAVLTRPQEHPNNALPPIEFDLLLRRQLARPKAIVFIHPVATHRCVSTKICRVSKRTAHVAVAWHLARSRSPAGQIYRAVHGSPQRQDEHAFCPILQSVLDRTAAIECTKTRPPALRSLKIIYAVAFKCADLLDMEPGSIHASQILSISIYTVVSICADVHDQAHA
eukprot:6206455-Pleurochrysis_carterae.AAC.1